MTTEIEAIKPFESTDSADEADVRRVVDDYYCAWSDADPDRMARVLHPQLAKRGWITDDHGQPFIDADTSESMVEWTRRGIGRTDDPIARAIDVRVVEVYDDIATALVHTPRYIETLHLIRTADGWRILNALWRTP
jgi:hypothetical protein